MSEQDNVEIKQWTQPLFMVYDASTDEKVPLTQVRLEQLIAAERQYQQMICQIRDMHEGFCFNMRYTPKKFAVISPDRE